MSSKPGLNLETFRRVVDLIPAGCRPQATLVAVIMLTNALLELSGVAGVLPLALAATDAAEIERNVLLRNLYHFSGVSQAQFVPLLCAIFLIIVLLMNLSRALTVWTSSQLTYEIRHHLACDLLRKYLSKPYIWYLDKNTSVLAKDVLHEVDQLTGSLISGTLKVVSKSLAAGFIFFGLVLLEPVVALVTLVVIGVVYRQIFRFFQKRLKEIGEERHQVDSMRFRTVDEAFAGVKEAMAFERRQEFVEDFAEQSLKQRDVKVQFQLVGEMPRFLTETLAVGAILVAMVYLTLTQQSKAIPILGVYIMATWRVVPAVQSLYRHAIDLKFFLPALDAVYTELRLTEDQPGWMIGPREPLEFEREVRLEEVSFRYPTSEEAVIKSVDLVIEKHTSVALIGRTGDGKTTLADLVAGHFEPDQGSVFVDDLRLTTENAGRWRRMVGCVPQEIYIADDSVYHNIALGTGARNVDHEAVERAARVANIHDFVVNELPEGYETRLGERGVTLSGGQRQRLGIARALYHDPEFLILDEATSSLDNLTERAVMDAIAELSKTKTLLVIAHRLSTVKACDKVCFVERGEIRAQGTFSEVEAALPQLSEWVQLDEAS